VLINLQGSLLPYYTNFDLFIVNASLIRKTSEFDSCQRKLGIDAKSVKCPAIAEGKSCLGKPFTCIAWCRSGFFCVFSIIIWDSLPLRDGSCTESFVFIRWQHILGRGLRSLIASRCSCMLFDRARDMEWHRTVAADEPDHSVEIASVLCIKCVVIRQVAAPFCAVV